MFQEEDLPETPIDLRKAAQKLAEVKSEIDDRVIADFIAQNKLSNHYKYGYRMFRNSDFQKNAEL